MVLALGIHNEQLISYFVANNIDKVTERAADGKEVAVTFSLIVQKRIVHLKIFPMYKPIKHMHRLQNLEGLLHYLRLSKLQGPNYYFYHTVQSASESVTEYAIKLKRLVMNCNFGPYLTRALSGPLVFI